MGECCVCRVIARLIHMGRDKYIVYSSESCMVKLQGVFTGVKPAIWDCQIIGPMTGAE